MDHTGPNNQFGGVNGGLFRVAYHVGIAGVVNSEPIKPANWQTIKLIMSLKTATFHVPFMMNLRCFPYVLYLTNHTCQDSAGGSPEEVFIALMITKIRVRL